jgi:hypothetical protein
MAGSQGQKKPWGMEVILQGINLSIVETKILRLYPNDIKN